MISLTHLNYRCSYFLACVGKLRHKDIVVDFFQILVAEM